MEGAAFRNPWTTAELANQPSQSAYATQPRHLCRTWSRQNHSARNVAAAGVTHGGLQHHFRSKADLVAAVDQYAIELLSQVLDAGGSLPESSPEHLKEPAGACRRCIKNTPGSWTTSPAPSSRTENWAKSFDGLFHVSEAQLVMYVDSGKARSDLDPIWGVLNPLMIRMGAFIMRPHIERHPGTTFLSTSQLTRWDRFSSQIIRYGQLRNDCCERIGGRNVAWTDLAVASDENQ